MNTYTGTIDAKYFEEEVGYKKIGTLEIHARSGEAHRGYPEPLVEVTIRDRGGTGLATVQVNALELMRIADTAETVANDV